MDNTNIKLDKFMKSDTCDELTKTKCQDQSTAETDIINTQLKEKIGTKELIVNINEKSEIMIKKYIEIFNNSYENFKICYENPDFRNKCKDLEFLKNINENVIFRTINVDYYNNKEFKELYENNEIFKELFHNNEQFFNLYINNCGDFQNKCLENQDNFLKKYSEDEKFRELINYTKYDIFNKLITLPKFKELFQKDDVYRKLLDYRIIFSEVGIMSSSYELKESDFLRFSDTCYEEITAKNKNTLFYFFAYFFPKLRNLYLYDESNNVNDKYNIEFKEKLRKLFQSDNFTKLFHYSIEFRNKCFNDSKFFTELYEDKDGIMIPYYFFYYTFDGNGRILYHHCPEFKKLYDDKLQEKDKKFFCNKTINEYYIKFEKQIYDELCKNQLKELFEKTEFQKRYNADHQFKRLILFSEDFRKELVSDYDKFINLNTYEVKYYYNLYIHPHGKRLFDSNEKFRELHDINNYNTSNISFVFLYSSNKLFQEMCNNDEKFLNNDEKFLNVCYNIYKDTKAGISRDDEYYEILTYFYYTVDPHYRELYDSSKNNKKLRDFFNGIFTRLYNECAYFRGNFDYNKEFQDKCINDENFMAIQFRHYVDPFFRNQYKNNWIFRELIQKKEFMEYYDKRTLDILNNWNDIDYQIKMFNIYIANTTTITISNQTTITENNEKIIENNEKITENKTINIVENEFLNFDTIEPESLYSKMPDNIGTGIPNK